MLEQRSLFCATAVSSSRMARAVGCDCGYWHCRPAWSGAEDTWLLLSPARKPADRIPLVWRLRYQDGADISSPDTSPHYPMCQRRGLATEMTAHAAACVALTPAWRVLWAGVAGSCRRGGGRLGQPGVQPCPDLLRGVGAAAPLVPGDHYPAGRHACEGCQAEYLPPAHLSRLRLCLACASAWMRPWT